MASRPWIYTMAHWGGGNKYLDFYWDFTFITSSKNFYCIGFIMDIIYQENCTCIQFINKYSFFS